MLPTTRWLACLACGMVLLACADSTDPVAPGAAPSAAPQLDVSGGLEPTAEELAQMPDVFGIRPTLVDYWTDVGFIPLERRAYAQSFMRYVATNATQNVKLSLRYENKPIGSTDAYGEDSHIFPDNRTLWTIALIGVSGACGHLADGSAIHKAWHQFFGAGWKFFSWGNVAGTSGDSQEQPQCPPARPPSPGEGGGPEDYEGGCELCQQWLYYIDGDLVDEWWDCEEIDGARCSAGAR